MRLGLLCMTEVLGIMCCSWRLRLAGSRWPQSWRGTCMTGQQLHKGSTTTAEGPSASGLTWTLLTRMSSHGSQAHQQCIKHLDCIVTVVGDSFLRCSCSSETLKITTVVQAGILAVCMFVPLRNGGCICALPQNAPLVHHSEECRYHRCSKGSLRTLMAPICTC